MRKIALVGNPNTGKSSIFNLLTGLKQHVGNFPGVTVDKRTGSFSLPSNELVHVLDLPGTYSLFPRSEDERIVMEVLSDPAHPNHPELAVVVADLANLERNLLLYTQLNDLGIPSILAFTMPDMAEEKSIQTDLSKLSFHLGGVPVVEINGRTGQGIDHLKQLIESFQPPMRSVRFSTVELKSLINDPEAQIKDTEWRFGKIREILRKVQQSPPREKHKNFRSRLDDILVHPVWGYVIFIGILMLIFQFIFRFAEFPMNWIDGTFAAISHWIKANLPEGVLTNLLAEGVVPVIGGVVIFIPQIALLFFLLGLLEESGYMSRVVFIMDRLVRPFGLNGKSVVPLVSSVACAIPGIMAARTISSWKDRLITIMVAPLMSCSARIPVFTLLISLTIPEGTIWGVFNLKGTVLFGLYALGLVSALLAAWVFKLIIRSREPGFLLMEMPAYQWPRLKHIVMHVKEKVGIFIVDAGKVILAISIVLWALCSYGPSGRMDRAEEVFQTSPDAQTLTPDEFERKVNSVRLENSFIGIIGKAMEPAIRPLGYDWKIGIALLTSFAAREVFVGSMATIYSAGEDFEEKVSLLDRMRREVSPTTGLPIYTVASGVSLMVFYVYAMQCMSTLAVVRRETRSWKWPIIQMVYMGVLAYLAAWLTYSLLS